jgi:hypothetical protein
MTTRLRVSRYTTPNICLVLLSGCGFLSPGGESDRIGPLWEYDLQAIECTASPSARDGSQGEKGPAESEGVSSSAEESESGRSAPVASSSPGFLIHFECASRCKTAIYMAFTIENATNHELVFDPGTTILVGGEGIAADSQRRHPKEGEVARLLLVGCTIGGEEPRVMAKPDAIEVRGDTWSLRPPLDGASPFCLRQRTQVVGRRDFERVKPIEIHAGETAELSFLYCAKAYYQQEQLELFVADQESRARYRCVLTLNKER